MTYQDPAGYSSALNIALAAWILSVRLRVFLRFAVVVVVIAAAAAAAVHHAAADNQTLPAQAPVRTAAARRGGPARITATRPGHFRRRPIPRPRDSETVRLAALLERRAEADTTWTRAAACARHPNADLWFPVQPSGKDAQHAVEICRLRCPVRADCYAYGLRFEGSGIWGGRHQWQLDMERTPGLSKLLRRAL